MLKICKFGRSLTKIVQLKHSRKFGNEPCRKPCPPSYVCKQPKVDPDWEEWLASFNSFVHPFLRCNKPKDFRPYRNLFFFVCLPICLCMYVNVYYMTPPRKRPKFVRYEYLRIRTKRLPWDYAGDEKTLFHNPYYNALPDGYEFEVPEEEEFDPRPTDCEQKRN